MTASADKGDTAASHKEDVVLDFNSDIATLARHDGEPGNVFRRQHGLFLPGVDTGGAKTD